MALGLGVLAGAPMASADDPPLPPPAHKARETPLPAGALSDADIERIALKILEIQERRRAKSAAEEPVAADLTGTQARPGSGGQGPAAPHTPRVVDSTDSPPPPPPLPSYGTSRQVAVPSTPNLPPPVGVKETRFGLPLFAGFGGTPAPSTYSTMGSGQSHTPLRASTPFVDQPTPDERYFLLGGATGASSGGGGQALPPVLVAPNPADRRAARLLSADGHSASALQDEATYGDRDRSLFLGASSGYVVTGGGGSAAEIRTLGGQSYVVEGGADSRTYQQIVPGWVAMVAAQGKFSIAASSASNATFKELGVGRANSVQKGFNTDSADVASKVGVGSFWGHVRAAYFSSPSGADSEVELLHAYGDAAFKDKTSDPKERLILRLGESPVRVGLYNGTEWEKWAWQARPLVYGRLFNGNLIGMGIDALIRPEVRDPHRDLMIGVGMFNGNSKSLPGFLNSDKANQVGSYPTGDNQRYSLTDFLYYADVSGVIDLTPSSASACLLHGGGFALYGPNGTGEDGETLVYGFRGRLLWLRCRTATPGVTDGFLLESEFVNRDYHVDVQGANPARDLADWGGYVSALYTVDRAVPGRISFGAKYDFVSSSGENYVAAGVATRADDPMRADRTRWTGLFTWEPEPTMPVFGKFAFSFEYVYDEAEFLGEDKHSVIVGLQVR